uniref:Uncharacterized protein n=1 Tax=Rhizophora mucronata TaxID=61149 RepID=A0A2P2J9N4_RHIMU
MKRKTQAHSHRAVPNWRNQDFKISNLLNPSKEARTISPGNRLKNFLPALEFTIELVKNPETFTTPERIRTATFSDIFVNFLTLLNLLMAARLTSISSLFLIFFFKNSLPQFSLSTVTSPHHKIPLISCLEPAAIILATDPL